jgi:arginine N-succinyltransferase
MFLITDVKPFQINQIINLAKILNSKNLPNEKNALESIIKKSNDSFSGKILNHLDRQYVFAIVHPDTKKVIGTSQITAQHGNKYLPHTYLQIFESQQYSTTLGIIKNHKMLQIGFDYEGFTEIGGLVVDPNYRMLREKIGKQLSLVRFLFMAQTLHNFSKRVIAELLPPKNKKNEYALWKDLGYKFTGLEYDQADTISRENKEFIKSLFIPTQICTTLLSHQAQAAIGAIGKESKAAAYMLENIGFKYHYRVDPFDGGPYYEAEIEDITALKDAKIFKIFAINFAADQSIKQDMLISIFHNKFKNDAEFICIKALAIIKDTNIYVESKVLDLLKVSNGDEVYTLILN